VVAHRFEKSSGDKKFDALVITTVTSAELPPLPLWFQGQTLKFKFKFSGKKPD